MNSKLRNILKELKNNPDYKFASIYADEGISGTDTKKKKRIQYND